MIPPRSSQSVFLTAAIVRLCKLHLYPRFVSSQDTRARSEPRKDAHDRQEDQPDNGSVLSSNRIPSCSSSERTGS